MIRQNLDINNFSNYKKYKINDCIVYITEINNTIVFNTKLSDEFANLSVPKFYIEEQDRYIENYDDPDYHEALKLKELEFQENAFITVLENAIIKLETSDLIETQWLKFIKAIRNKDIFQFQLNNFSWDSLLCKYFIFTNNYDKQRLIRDALLCEAPIYKIMKMYNVSRSGEEIFTYPLKFTVDTKIDWTKLALYGEEIVHPFDEYNACTKSNMDWSKWLNNEYSKSIKESTIALYRMNRIIDSHQEDAVAIENEKKSKK